MVIDLTIAMVQAIRLVANQLCGRSSLTELSLLSKVYWAVRAVKLKQLKGLILAQNERWRRGLGMQVVRDR